MIYSKNMFLRKQSNRTIFIAKQQEFVE